MKRSVAIILIVVISVAAVALVAFVGKGAVTVIGQIGDIFGSGGEFPDLPSAPNSPDLPHESDTGLKFTETEPIETEPLLPSLNSGKLDFEDLELTILLPDTELYHREWYVADVDKVYTLPDAIAARDKEVPEKLGLKINYKYMPDDAVQFRDLVLSDILIGEHNYDIVLNQTSVMSQLAYRCALANLLDKNEFPYFDFSEKCWFASVGENLTVNEKLYFNTGAFSTSTLDNISMIWMNVLMYEEYRENGAPEFLREYAAQGKWTYEDMYQMITAFDRTVPDKTAIVIDSDLSDNIILSSLATAFDVDSMRRINNSWAYDLASNSRAEDVLMRTKELYLNSGVDRKSSVEKFSECECLFLMTKLYKDQYTNSAITREMDSIPGILPLPKYDDEQQEYKAWTDGGSFMGIIDHSKSSTKTHSLASSAFMQMTALRSHESSLGYYFQNVVMPKWGWTSDLDLKMRVQDSITILESMTNNIEFEFCNVYSSELGGIGDIWGEAYSNNKTLAQSYLDKQSEYEESLSKLDKFFGVSQ